MYVSDHINSSTRFDPIWFSFDESSKVACLFHKSTHRDESVVNKQLCLEAHEGDSHHFLWQHYVVNVGDVM